MSVKIVTNKDQKPSGIFIPLEDLEQLKTTVKPNTSLYKLLDELTIPEEIRKVKETFVLPSGLTIQESEQLSRNNVEEIYINAFAKGLSRYYKDERCISNKNMIKAKPDGSEDLVDFDWQTRKETFLKQLQPQGKGKYAFLLHDPRYLALKAA